jgi:hypothetical protein
MRCILLMGVALQAQIPMHPGVVRGQLVAWTGSNRAGEITVKNREGVESCQFDARTYFEREQQMIPVSGLAPGDPLEVVADHKVGSSACYARTVHVANAHARLFTPGVRPPLRSGPSPTESFAPRGDRTFGGRVVKLGLSAVTIQTRRGEVELVLRPDTRYAADGLTLDAASLALNTHVFVRAGRDVNGDIEAYQIFWGRVVGAR